MVKKMGFLDIAIRNYNRMKEEEEGVSLIHRRHPTVQGTVLELVATAEAEQLDKKAKQAGLMIAIPGEMYTLTISTVSAVYIERVGDKWEAWRETHCFGQRKPISVKVIGTSSELEYVLVSVKKYLRYIGEKRIKNKLNR
jgi:hypothetical protein